MRGKRTHKEVTHFTKTERSKIYKTKRNKVKNSVDVYSIPKGKKKIGEREKIIIEYLRKISRELYCTALADYVGIRKVGRTETKFRASGKYKSTIAALNLEEVLINATYIKPVPKKKNVKAQKIFKQLHILACFIEGVGYAKILIGEVDDEHYDPANTRLTHYCITQMSVEEIKK